MSLKIVSVLGLLSLLSGIEAQNGQPCHASFFQFTPRHSLNISAYMGDWYMHEIASSDIGNFPEPDWRCAKRSLSLTSNSSDLDHFTAVDTFVNITDGVSTLEMKDISVNATRSPLNAMWYMTAESGNETISTDVIILSADLQFQQWTVVYSCSIRGPDRYRYEVVMAMTRSRTITNELRQFLKAIMVGQGFRIGDHYSINQSNCTQFESENLMSAHNTVV